ncbi:phage holin family protein [uncultured Aeromicrobium sp.]|uniref:phage holin family protein n=1 Tax=uncultured Aeromicrobium sp. TaxID=337820 RepID=UPI0025DA0B58|nr:phage holin family protein [uncultured Aeromicrobium sp.]
MSERQPGTEDPTIGRLVADVTRDFSSLVQHEIQLAKSELRVSVRAGGMGAALLAVAAFMLLLVVILASITIGFFLTMTGLHPAWAFLIVTGAYLLLALLLAFIGVRRFRKVKAPQRTIATAKQIPATLKGKVE